MKRVRIEYEDGDVYSGEVDAENCPHGAGTMKCPSSWSEMAGEWENGRLMQGTMTDLEGNTYDGSFRADGTFLRGSLTLYDGSVLTGQWNEDNQASGSMTFHFPDGRALVGTFVKGVLEKGLFEGEHEMTFEGDFPGERPLQCDAYEARYVYVKPSALGEEAGEGLFAKTNLPAHLIVSYYNGVRVEQSIVNERTHVENSNVVLLDSDDQFCIDVPPPFDSLTHYAASLGHKANHGGARRRNCAYVDAFHPRFGHISAIKTIQPIGKDEELLLDYEYIGDKPPWYPPSQ